MRRSYLDHAATTPLRAEARAAMTQAMEVFGNGSSVHGEGRQAKGLIERARADLAEALGAGGAQIVFTSGASEALALALAGRGLVCAPIEHEAALAWCDTTLPVAADGRVAVADPGRTALQWANSETGIVQALPQGLAVSDLTQGFGKLPFAYAWAGVEMAVISAHKFGGPKGVGALILPEGLEIAARILGGGQEQGRRAGTENIIGIAGMAAAATAAQADLASGRWGEVAALRDLLEAELGGEDGISFAGQGVERLPNVTNILSPGWKGETQVMVMDLAGYAVSAGSACSSGKLRPSKVLAAMGLAHADCALRVSLGVETTKAEVLAFAGAFRDNRRRALARIGTERESA